MTSTLPTPPDSAKTAYIGEASARSSDRCFGARLHALLAAGLATFLLSLAVAVRPERTYTALVAIGLPQQDANGAEADGDGLALDSATLSTQLAAALQDDAVLVRAAEAAQLLPSPAGATALLKELRAATLVAPKAATDAGAQITVESKNAAEAQAWALALAEGFAADYRRRALARGQQAVTEARQAVTDSAAAAQASRHAFDEFLASHFSQAAAPVAAPPAAPPTPAPPAPTPKPADESPAAVADAQSEPAGEPATPAALPEETELQRLKQERRQLLVRYTKYHYKVQVVDMHIARLEKELAILAPKRADALPAPKPAEAAPAPEPSPDAAALSIEAAAQEAAAVAAAEAQAQREQLTQEFETLRAQVDSARAAAEQAVLHERAALEHQATLASQAELRVAAPVVTYRTVEGLDRRGVAWSVLLAATVGGLAFCMTGPQRHVYRTPAEVEDDLELPLVAALASRSAALPRRPKLLPAIAARLTACGELVLVAIVCGLAVLAYLEPDFRSQLIESPLAAYTDAASRLLGR